MFWHKYRTWNENKYPPLIFITQFKISSHAWSTHKLPLLGFWWIGALVDQMHFFQPQKSDILWDNYLAIGHEYNTDGASHRLTVKLAFSLTLTTASNTLSLAVASFTCGNIRCVWNAELFTVNTFSLSLTPSRSHKTRQGNSDGHVLSWCGQHCGIT